jgi:hypothetical protein
MTATNMTRAEWLAESDRLRSLAVRATGDHARALHDRADECVRQADRAACECAACTVIRTDGGLSGLVDRDGAPMALPVSRRSWLVWAHATEEAIRCRCEPAFTRAMWPAIEAARAHASRS